MAGTSKLDIVIPQFNPSTGLPEGMTPEEYEALPPETKAYLEYLERLARENDPEYMRLRSGQQIQKEDGPMGISGSAPPGTPASPPPLEPTQIPATTSQGLIPSSQNAAWQASSWKPGVVPAITSQGASQASGGWLAGLFSGLGGWKGLSEIAGGALGANSQASANNRGAQLAAGMDLERLLLDRDDTYFNQRIRREQEGRAGSSDAWRKLVSTDYAMNRPAQPNITPYAAPQRSLAGLQPGAQALQAEAMQRLKGGNPIAPVTERPLAVDPNLMKPGALESITGYVSPWLTLIGRV